MTKQEGVCKMRNATMILIGLVLASACTVEPIGKAALAGSTIIVPLPDTFAPGPTPTSPPLTPGFGSKLGGPDPQRGETRFYLCVANTNCALTGSPPNGYRLETAMLTRATPDRMSLGGVLDVSLIPKTNPDDLRGIKTVAVVNIPRLSAGGPRPGTYNIVPRLFKNATETQLVVNSADLTTLQIIAGDGTPSIISRTRDFLTGAWIENGDGSLAGGVSPPSITFELTNASGPVPAAAELVLRYPFVAATATTPVQERITILSVVETSSLGQKSMVRYKDDTSAHTLTMRLVDPDRLAKTVTVSFLLNSGQAPVAPSDFSIVGTPKLYDLNGALIAAATQSYKLPALIR
jgi:hypothetical protein